MLCSGLVVCWVAGVIWISNVSPQYYEGVVSCRCFYSLVFMYLVMLQYCTYCTTGVMKPFMYFLHTSKNECFHSYTVCISSSVSAVVLCLCSIIECAVSWCRCFCSFVLIFMYLQSCCSITLTAEISVIFYNVCNAWRIAGFHNKYDLYELYTSIVNFFMMIKTVKMDLFIPGHCTSLKLLGCIAVVAWCGLLLQTEWCGCLGVCWWWLCALQKRLNCHWVGKCRPFGNYVLDTAQILSREEELLRRHAQWSMTHQRAAHGNAAYLPPVTLATCLFGSSKHLVH